MPSSPACVAADLPVEPGRGQVEGLGVFYGPSRIKVSLIGHFGPNACNGTASAKVLHKWCMVAHIMRHLETGAVYSPAHLHEAARP